MTIRALFNSKGSLRDQLGAQEQRAMETVKKVPAETLLATPDADLTDQLFEQFAVEPLQVHRDRAESLTGVAAIRVDVSRDPYRDVYDRSRPAYVDGTRYELAVPFDGEAVFFELQPSTFLGTNPRGEIRGQSVIVTYEGPDPTTAEGIKAYLDEQLILLDQWSSFSRK